MFSKSWRGVLALACATGAAAWSHPAFATNGYFVNGFDVTQQGTAGAGLTEGDGPVSSAENPAVGVKMGNVAGACMSAFLPYRKAEVGTGSGTNPLTPGEYSSKDNLFLIPCAGANTLVNDKTAVGVSLVANGGMETYYSQNPFAGMHTFNPGFAAASSPLGVNLQQAFVSFNGARTIADGFSIGLAPVFAVQSIRAYGLEPFEGASQNAGSVTGNGDDWSFGGGLRLGGVWDANRWVSMAAAYQTRMWMSSFHKYSGLFADSAKFDIPPELSLGSTIRPTKGVAVMFDYQRIFYSQVAAIGNTELTTAQLGTPNGPGFGWKDMNVYHIGAKWNATDALTLRTGWSYATDIFNPNEAEFNLISPGVIKQHVSVGASYKFAPHWTLDGAYTHAFANTVNGLGNPNFYSGSQPIGLELSEEIATAGISYRW
ncbi:MAG: outer membrane protein transport protein [Magnetospirillum sp.]|nr:outer membrane protein transport protein [Magnetospirillum sp.]